MPRLYEIPPSLKRELASRSAYVLGTIEARKQPANYRDFVEKLFKYMESSALSIHHAATGIAGEAGELLDASKKHWIYNKPIDLENVTEELGDLLFYITAMLNMTGLTWQDIEDYNRVKLAKRYGEACEYSDSAAQARADKEPGQ